MLCPNWGCRWSELQPLTEQFMGTDDDLGGAVLKCYG